MTVDTMFKPSSGGGSSTNSSDYVKDYFQDTSRPADSNTGLTSSALTNPLSYSFANNDTPQYGIKTLFVKDVVLVSDRSKWINNSPTYEVEFTESNPSIKAYAVGNIRVRNTISGKIIEMRSIGDLFAVTGIIEQVAWMIAPSTLATASADTYTDGIAVSTLNFNSLSSDATQGVTKYNLLLHNASPSSYNIHDYRIKCNQAGGAFDVGGIVVYSQSSNLVIYPGSSYNAKTLIATTTGATLTPYVPTGHLGANTILSKLATGAYDQSSNEPINLASVGVGVTQTNSIAVTTGTGASFGAGYGVVGSFGSSQFVGVVASVSTDTLVMSQTLSFGISGALFRIFTAGPTFPISATLYSLRHSLDMYELNNTIQGGNFGATNSNTMYYANTQQNYYAFGKDLQISNFDGNYGLGFSGNTAAFFQVDGNYAAAEIEYAANGIFHGTFAINGLPAWGQNAGASGCFRETVFSNGGPGWNSFVFTPGQSFVGCYITKVNLYDLATPVGITAGLLSSYPSFMDTVTRSAENASIMQLGNISRKYADQLYLQGTWTRGITSTAAGAVFYGTGTASSALNFQYYGKNFALIGTEGGSMSAVLDGASISSAFNAMKTVSTTGWHNLALTYKAGATCVINAVDFERANQNELINLQKTEPLAQLSTIPKVFIQSHTPLEAKDGDIWVFTKTNAGNTTPETWFKLFNQWNRFSFTQTTDDPNIAFDFFFKMTGAVNGGGGVDGVVAAEVFNFTAWSAITNVTGARVYPAQGESKLLSAIYVLGGRDTGSAITSTSYKWNKLAWSTDVAITAGREGACTSEAFSGLWFNQGSSGTNSGSSQNTAYKFDSVAWNTMTAWGNQRDYCTSFFVNSLLSSLQGEDTGGTTQTTHQVRNSSDTVSAGTAVTNAAASAGGCAAGNGLTTAAVINGNNANQLGNNTATYVWSGTAWSTVNGATDVAGPYAAFSRTRLITVTTGGYNGAASSNASRLFNSSAFSVTVSNTTATNHGAGGVIL